MKKMLAPLCVLMSMIASGEDAAVLRNEGLHCPDAPRAIFRPKVEAPKGSYGWMTNSTFVATLELEGTPPKVPAVCGVK